MGERSRPDLADPDESAAGAERADSLARSELLRAALIGVIERYEPEVARVLRGEAPQERMSTRLLARTIQAQAIWFQLYVLKDRGFMRNALERAQAAGVTTLVFTVDMPTPGARYRDAHSGMSGPFAAQRRMLQAVPPGTVIAPGHGPMTTAQNELSYNPFVV